MYCTLETCLREHIQALRAIIPTEIMKTRLFKSFLMGGFECSSHRRRDGRRLDMIAATGHDRHAHADYARLAEHGIKTARDGLRWNLIELSPGRYDFSSVDAQMDAAQKAGVQVIWDLFHYGYPEDLNIFSEDLPPRLADLAAAFARLHIQRTGAPPIVVPVNEISFFSWIAGEIGRFYPFANRRGDELKRNLAMAAITAARAIKAVAPGARVTASEPIVHIKASDPELHEAAENYRISQYQAFDMLTGRFAPELGGGSDCLDFIGLNYYPHNQWHYPDREMIPRGHEHYRPFRELLSEVSMRYGMPVFISETGTEAYKRAQWFKYVADECEAAIEAGVDLQGICLYPIVNHPGWEDERHCKNGLWDYCDDLGIREIYEPLARETRRFTRTPFEKTATNAGR